MRGTLHPRRWQNYLNNDIKQGGWSEEEDRVLLEGHKLHGNKWTEIARMVTGRTDNAVKNRHAVLVKKEEKREEARSGGGSGNGSGGGGGSGSAGGANVKRKRQTGDAATEVHLTSSDSQRRRGGQGGGGGKGGANPKETGTQTSGGTHTSGGSASWRPKLSVKIPGKNNNVGGFASTSASGGGLPSSVGLGSVRGAPPSLENLQTSASLTAAEIELLKQVQELISPNAAGFAMDPPQIHSTRATRSNGTANTLQVDHAAPQTPLETPTVDLQQVMNWILSVTPRAGASGSVQVGAPGSLVSPIMSTGATAATTATAPGGSRPPISLESAGGSGQHSTLLRKLLSEKLSGSPMASPAHGGAGTGYSSGARRSPRLGDHTGGTPTGLDLANGIASGGLAAGPGCLPTSPNFTQSELNMLLNALGGAGDTPSSGVQGGINPFGRADDAPALATLSPRAAKNV